MVEWSYILADADDVLKVIGAIIVLLIWGVSALANLAKKQKEQTDGSREAMERAMREQVEAARRQQAAALGQMGAGPPPPLPPPAVRRQGPVVPPMRPKARTQQQQRTAPPVPIGAQRPRPVPQRGPVVPQRGPVVPQRGPVVPQRGPVAPRPRGPAVPPQRTKKAQRRQQQAVPPPPPLLEEIEGPSSPSVLESEIGAGTTAASPSRRAAEAGPMLRLTPQSLRQQFILTEILQPPMALRDEPARPPERR